MEGLRSVRAFGEAATWVSEVFSRVDDVDWERPGLGEWNLRALVGHTSRAVITVAEALSKPWPGKVDLESAGAYYLRVAELPGASPDAVRMRGVAAGDALGSDPAAEFGRLAAETMERLSGVADPTIPTIAGAMRLSDYLETRVFELVVHGLDVCGALELSSTPPREALDAALSIASQLAMARGRGGEVLLAVTGRTALPTGFSVLSSD